MKIIRHIAMLLTVTLILTGCSKDDGDSQTAVGEEGRSEICVKTNLMRMMTKTGPTTVDSNSELQGYDLKIDAYYHDTETKYLDGTKLHYDSAEPAALKWKFWDGSAQLHYYWPFEGSKTAGGATASTLDFVGFCPYTKPTYIGDPTYNHSTGVSFSCNLGSYVTNAAQAGMQEFLIAVLNEQTLATQTDAGGALPLVFKHPFALIKFVIAEGSGTHVKVNNIRIDDLYTTATCTYDGTTMTWDDHDDEADMTITPEDPLQYGTSSTETDYFMVIPKNYGTMTLTVNGTWDDWSNVTKDLSTDVNIDWAPGYIYTYNLTVTPYALKVDISKFTEQW